MKKEILNKKRTMEIKSTPFCSVMGVFSLGLKRKAHHSRGATFVYQNGITLIALIITIIILLILSAVVINVTVGENGLFKTAKTAAMDYKISEMQEKLEIEKVNLVADMNGDIPSVTEYITYIISKDIITEADVTHIDDNTKEIVVDKYMFLVEKEENGNIKITYNGIATKDPKIGKIEIVKTTINTISIKVIASNVDNGDYKYYIKNITTGEEYATIPVATLKTNEYEFTGLIRENKYKIKVELVNENGKAEKETEEIETVPTLVQSVTLNKSTLELEKGGNDTDTSLTVTVLPIDAEDKSLTWTSSDENVATVTVVNGTITVTAIGKGTATITATANDGSEKSASCKVTVKMAGEIEYSWQELGEIAKIISDNYGYKEGQINEDTEEINVSYKGKNCKLTVGDWTTVNGKKVRILGFNHDDLVTTTTNEQGEKISWNQYGEGTTNTKAGISFEYVGALEYNYREAQTMNSNVSNNGGWRVCKLRNTLNTNYINSFENKAQIKQVIKKYIPTYNVASTNDSSDYLWLLSCSEIWDNGYQAGAYGLAITGEGKQYKYYQLHMKNTPYNSVTSVAEKCFGDGTLSRWWLRSPSNNQFHFCQVFQNCYAESRNSAFGGELAPGFAI